MGGAFLAFVAQPYSDGVTMKTLHEVDLLLHQPTLHPISFYWFH